MLRRRDVILATALAAALVPLIGLAAGVFLAGTQPADGSGNPAFPRFLNGSDPGVFALPGDCAQCHATYRQPGERIHEPWDSWAGSMMANAARDPLFWAALDVANQDDAALGDVGVGDLCLRCHVPRAWFEGRSSCATAWGEEFDGACLEGPATVPDNDFEGIICQYCHRMYDASNPPPFEAADPAAPYGENAQVYLTRDDNVMLGPYDDADPRSHASQGSAFHRSSAFCGECHDVTNPVRNRRDAVTGADTGRLMPIERTWSEYRQSAFADPASPDHATCQACHMPPADLDGDGSTDDAFACKQAPGLRGEATALQGPLRTHFFAGANTWMIGVLRAEIGAALGRDESFQAAADASMALLLRAVTADLAAPATAIPGGSFAARVRVTNRAGHGFPTGYPEGRRAWIRLSAGEDLDDDGTLAPAETTFTSGAYDDATGLLTRDAQLRTYEAKLGIFDYNGTGRCDTADALGRDIFHFVLNDCVAENTRIPPLGFVPGEDTRPVGRTYPFDPARPGTLVSYDDAPYLVPVPAGATHPVLLRAEVLYQSTSREYVEFLRDENRSTCDPSDPACDPTQPDARPNRGEKLHALWEAHGRAAPVVLATATARVDLAAQATGACCIGAACSELAEPECVAQAGDYRGDGTTCALTACAPSGACCIGAACSELTEADCVAQVGDYRGDGTTCGSVPCALPPPGEASDAAGGARPLLVTGHDRATGVVTIEYEPACDATDHLVARGPLPIVSALSHADVACGLGISGTASFAAGPGSSWFLVVGTNGDVEGSYGRSSFGAERPERPDAAACDAPQDLSATCR